MLYCVFWCGVMCVLELESCVVCSNGLGVLELFGMWLCILV